jgi:hypothetical protein
MTYIIDKGEYSVLSEGSIIYRGQTDAFEVIAGKAILRRGVLDPDRNTFFGLEPESTTRNYGITTDLLINSDIMLYNINNTEARNRLAIMMRELGDGDTLRALDLAYPVENDEVKRDSDPALDNKVLDFICKYTSYEGYIQPEMKKPGSDPGFMHSEIAVCAPSLNKITQYIGKEAIAPVNGDTYNGLVDKHRDILMKRDLAAKRRKTQRLHEGLTATRLMF